MNMAYQHVEIYIEYLYFVLLNNKENYINFKYTILHLKFVKNIFVNFMSIEFFLMINKTMTPLVS